MAQSPIDKLKQIPLVESLPDMARHLAILALVFVLLFVVPWYYAMIVGAVGIVALLIFRQGRPI